MRTNNIYQKQKHYNYTTKHYYYTYHLQSYYFSCIKNKLILKIVIPQTVCMVLLLIYW